MDGGVGGGEKNSQLERLAEGGRPVVRSKVGGEPYS